MSLSETKPPHSVDVLRDHLVRGSTGCLSSSEGWRVYVMQGEVLAAHSPSDGAELVARLVHNRAITPRQGAAFARSVEQGRSAEELLLGHVPDALFHQLLAARFQQNLLEFVRSDAPVRFQPMDAIFVRNVQVGHDSRRLIDALEARNARIEALRLGGAGLTLRPGPTMASTPEERLLCELCDPALPLPALVGNSPFEPGVTLDCVGRMLQAGALVTDQELPRRSARPPAPAGDFGVEELFRLDDADVGVSPPPASPDGVGALMSLHAADLVPLEDSDEATELATEVVPAQGPPPLDRPLDPPVADPAASPPASDALRATTPVPAEPTQAPWSSHGGERVSLQGPEAYEPEDTADEDSAPEVEFEELEYAVPEPLPEDPAETFEVPRSDADDTWTPDEDEDEDEDPVALEAEGGEDPDGALEAPAEPTEEAARPASGFGVELEPPADDDGEDAVTQPADDEAALFGVDADAHEMSAEETALFGGSAAPTADTAFFDFDAQPDDLEMFEDRDHLRGGGQGQFTLQRELLDVVDLREEVIRPERHLPEPVEMPRMDDDEELVLEAIGAEDAELTEDDKVVSLSFGAPPLSNEELTQKLDVCNSVLAEVSAALDRARGQGSGATSVQLLLDGSPSNFAVLFHGLRVRPNGTFDNASAAANLARRPDAEWRALADRGIMDLIERSLSMAVEELGDGEIDHLLQRVAGYQQRLRT